MEKTNEKNLPIRNRFLIYFYTLSSFKYSNQSIILCNYGHIVFYIIGQR